MLKNFKLVTLLPSTTCFVVGRAGVVCVKALINPSSLMSYLDSLFLFASRQRMFDGSPFVIRHQISLRVFMILM